MNRRTFLQSVIAVPLVAVGIPCARAYLPTIRSNSDQRLLITSFGNGYVFDDWPRPRRFRVTGGQAPGPYDGRLTDHANKALADDLAQSIDDAALRHALASLKN